MPTEPHWTAYLAALLTPIIAIFGAYIGYQQWKINRHKLKLDLFDRRWAIYATTNDVLAALIYGSEVDRRKRANEFRRSLMDARFGCSKDTNDFLDKVNKRIASVVDAERALRNVSQAAPGRKDAEMLVAKEVEGCRADYDALVSVFGRELRINF